MADHIQLAYLRQWQMCAADCTPQSAQRDSDTEHRISGRIAPLYAPRTALFKNRSVIQFLILYFLPVIVRNVSGNTRKAIEVAFKTSEAAAMNVSMSSRVFVSVTQTSSAFSQVRIEPG